MLEVKTRPYHSAKLLLLLVALLALPRPTQAADPTLQWQTIVTPHFYIHFYRNVRHDEEQVARQVARAAEAAHARLTKVLRHTPSGRTHLVVTDDTDGANGSAQIVPMNIIRLFVTGPSSLSTLNDYDDWIYGLILHEYTHILHIDTIHGLAKLVNYVMGKTWSPNQVQPRWFIEGLATYYESARTSGGRLRNNLFDMYLRMAVLEGKLLEIDQISSFTRYYPRGNVPYLYGSHFVGYLADRFGEDKLTEISHRYGGTVVPYGINRIAKEVLGHTYLELYADFKRHLERRYGLVAEAVKRRGMTSYRALTSGGETSATPVYSKDGRELAFIDNDGGHAQTAIKVIDVRTGALKERYDLFGGSGLDFSPDGQHLVYAQSAVWRTFYSYDDLYVRHRASGRVRRLTQGQRARDPAVSPDGSQVAFVSSDLGTMNLELVPFAGGQGQVLLRGEQGDQVFTPRWSPDGRQLVYSRWQRGGQRDIYLLELASGKTRQLTADRALDTDPLFSADGQRIYFSSDRSGIYNVYCYQLQGGELQQVTNVLGGAFMPAVSPAEDQLTYVGFSAKGYDLHAMTLDRRRYLPALPYVDSRPAPPRLEDEPAPEMELESYSPWRTIYPRAWAFRFGTDAYGSTFGIDLNGADVVGRHSWLLGTTFSLSDGYTSYGMSYSYNRFWPSIGLDTSRYLWPRGGLIVDGEKRTYQEENYGAGLGIGLPVLRVPNHSFQVNVGYRFNWFRSTEELAPITEPGMVSPNLPPVGILSGATLGLSYTSLQRYAWSISLEKGRRITLGLRVDHPTLGSDFQNTQATYSWHEYLPIPWFYEHVLALRLAGGISAGDFSRHGLFALGGFPEQDVLRALLDNTRVSGAFLRGYPQGLVYGDQYHLFNVEYRLPLLNLERGFSSLPLYFTHLHLTLFADMGNAFFDEPALSDFKVGVGGELNVEAVVGYVLPVTFRVGYARGLMEGGVNQTIFLVGNSF